MVRAVFYYPFLHVFNATYMFYGTAVMYNRAILCIFPPNLEVEINIIIISVISTVYQIDLKVYTQ